MKDQTVYRDCFFAGTKEAVLKIKELKENYENVEIENFSVSTKGGGTMGIIIVFYSDLKKSELFDDDEWEALKNGSYIPKKK